MNDTPKYMEAIVEYLTNTEVLIIDGQKAIGAKCSLSAQKIEEAEIALMEKGLGQNVMYIQSGLRSRVKYFNCYSENQFRHQIQTWVCKEQRKYWGTKSAFSLAKLITSEQCLVQWNATLKICS